MRRAFTMIELILTMVILSIVAYVATGLIAKTYMAYNRVNTLHKANIKVELALNNLANRLSHAITGTIIKRKSGTTNLSPINSAPDDYDIIEWVGNDINGFEAHDATSNINSTPKPTPAWSGFCNIDSSNETKIITPGSDLNFYKTIVSNLSTGKIGNLQNIAIFFPGNFDYRNIGYKNTPSEGGGASNKSGIGIINGYDTTDPNNPYFTLKAPGIPRVTEHYKLAWSAYAVLPTNCGTDGCDLELRYNFKPWNNEYYNSGVRTTPRSLLATNVTVFKTFAAENRVHIKLCVKEYIGPGKTTSICKEKVVFK